jgi:hypothetical protein
MQGRCPRTTLCWVLPVLHREGVNMAAILFPVEGTRPTGAHCGQVSRVPELSKHQPWWEGRAGAESAGFGPESKSGLAEELSATVPRILGPGGRVGTARCHSFPIHIRWGSNTPLSSWSGTTRNYRKVLWQVQRLIETLIIIITHL